MIKEKGRLLFVGPAADHLGELQERLDQEGYVVAVARDGASALKALATARPDVVFLALDAEEACGARVLMDIRADEDHRDIPVVVIAGHQQLEAVEAWLAAGADDYLLIPISPALVKFQVVEYVELGRRRQESRNLAERESFLKMESDLQVAQRIQEGFLPKELPQPVGWEVAAEFSPAREVAGDFYDAFMLSQDRRLGFVIGDVVDKGVPAALFMALVRSLTRAFAQQNYSLSWTNVLEETGDGLSNLVPSRERGGKGGIPSTGTNALRNAVLLTNNFIVENHADLNMFATLFFGLLDPSNGRLAYINAGHNPPYLLGPDGTLRAKLKGTGPAVGMFPAVDFRIEYAQMEPGDILYAYTDGVTEARNVSRSFYTEARLIKTLGQPVESAAGLLRRVDGSLHEFIDGADQFDDITMVAVRRAPLSV